MSNPCRTLRAAILVATLGACATTEDDYRPTLHYVGSSTIANFLRDAEPIYGQVQFLLDTAPESAGGEIAVLEGRGDFAGVAGMPRHETLEQGVLATMIGRDAIAVIVHAENPVDDLGLEELRAIFTGRATNWNGLGGPDLPIRPLIVGPASATRNVFRSRVMGEDDYAGCEVVRPDSAIVDRVRADRGAIGQISFSFTGEGVKRVAIGGEAAVLDNLDYPITRPLYLLWWPGRGRVADFVSWAVSGEGAAVLARRFVAPGRGVSPRGRLRLFLVLALALGSCASPGRRPRPEGDIRYVGSSTVAMFLGEAEEAYGAVRFEIDTEPESEGGERAIVEGRTDLAGIARRPRPGTMQAGVVASLIGRDAIAVIVNARNPVLDLSSSDLRGIFTGRVANWNDVGGPDLPIEPFIVGEESATRRVFADAVLGGEEYAGCQVIRPDRDIVAAVAGTPGGIGQLSFSFLGRERGVREVSVDGTRPTVTNFDYPISRPLYLLWREGNPVVEAFVDWAQHAEGQRVVMRRFVGTHVVGSVVGAPEGAPRGTLVVYTETYPFYDGGIYYYPHRPYEVLTLDAALIRRVPNHRGENDEAPTRVDLPPGTYLVRTRTASGERPEFIVTIENGKPTELDVIQLMGRQR